MATDIKMRVAMVGVGGFGKYRRDRMRETGLFDIVAAYDLSQEALAQCHAEDGAQAVDTFTELLETPDIEALFISSGAKYHADQALAAMERGLHVFTEKPLCATPEEVYALLKMQRETGLVVGVGHGDHKSSAGCNQIKQMIAEGAFGNVATFECITAHSGGLTVKPEDWRADPDKNPGGMLFQCGCHSLHQLQFYFGPVKRVTSMMTYDVQPVTQIADVALCILEMESGLVGTLSAYYVTPYRHSLNIIGTKMSLYMDGRAPGYGDPSVIEVQYRQRELAEPREKFVLPRGGDNCGNIRSFYKAVREGGEPYPSLRDGALAVMAIFAAEESAKTGKTVDVPKIEYALA